MQYRISVARPVSNMFISTSVDPFEKIVTRAFETINDTQADHFP